MVLQNISKLRDTGYIITTANLTILGGFGNILFMSLLIIRSPKTGNHSQNVFANKSCCKLQAV